ncbi:MAG: Dyp-type peroxidase [Propionibacteriaceae bacterium]|nr:Dyp-type peroxidase [Propionibacteriaceae bacterium]
MPIDTTKSQDVSKDIGMSVIFATLRFHRTDRDAELEALRQMATRLPAIAHSLSIRDGGFGVRVSLGLSARAWEYFFPGAPTPAELEDFAGLSSDRVVMPADGSDLFLHVRAQTDAIVYEFMALIMEYVRDHVTVVDETHGFAYFEGRAIIGFIDGTEAPLPEESADYAVIGDEDPGFINGSYAFAQKWTHDMTAWNALSTEAQEKAVGRTKFTDLELEDDDKDPGAHNIASKVSIDGEEQKIVRMNVAWSNPVSGQTGTYFIGYSRRWSVTKAMLTQMLDIHDRLFDYSQITTGQVFFIPSKVILAQIAEGTL